MGTSKIEWLRSADGKLGYTINPIKGLCPVGCSYCYARRMYKRFKWNPEIRFDADTLLQTRISDHEGFKIFWGSTMELFGDWVKSEWLQSIFDYIRTENDLNTHIFLTKKPQNFKKYSPFPKNCWVGVSIPRYWDGSVIGHPEAFMRIRQLGEVKASVRFVSFEPLLASVASEFVFGLDLSFKAYGVNWIIIGACTPHSEKTAPKVEWVREIIESADKVNIPVFLKANLGWPQYTADGSPPFYKKCNGTWKLRQEFPIMNKELVNK